MNATPDRSTRIRLTAVARRALGVCASALWVGLLLPGGVSAQNGDQWAYEDGYGEAAYYADEGYPALTTRIWLDRGEDPVLDRGERARLYYRTSEDAFIAIFHIDTNGSTRLVFPRSPDEDNYVYGGRDFRLVFPGSSQWVVADDPGVGYFFSIASPEPLDFRDFGYSHYDGGWDLSNAGRRVYRDPYVAMDEFVERLIPDWEYVPYALDFSPYHVEERYEYPRFLCYDCHGFRPYASWNPYLATCTSFRVVVYDDPYYYPSTRYRGTQVVFARPVQPGLPRFEFKERARGEAPTPLLVRRATPSVSTPRPAVAPPSGRSPAVQRRSGTPAASPVRVPTRTRPSQALPSRGGPPPATSAPSRPTLERRTPTRTSPGSTARQPVTGTGGGPPARVTPTRPPTGSGGGGAAPARATPARPPTGSGGGGVAPTRAAPARATPSRSSTGGGTPARAAPTRATPTRAPARSSGGNPARTAPTRAAPTRTAPARAAPTRAPTGSGGGGGTPARAAPTRAAPTRSSGGTPARSAPTRATPARAPARSGSGPPARAAPKRPPTGSGGGGGEAAPSTD